MNVADILITDNLEIETAGNELKKDIEGWNSWRKVER